MSQSFSVITVTYNCAGTIEQTIRSVMGQNYPSVEHIVIDGKSTDGTADVIAKYAGSLAYHVSEPDSGIYDAMNKGLRHASGDVILFLNGDDYLTELDVLRRIAKYFETDDIEVVIGRVDAGGRISPHIGENELENVYFGFFFPHQATFARRGVYERLGGFDDGYRVSADFDWILRAYADGARIRWVDDVVSHFRLGGRSDSIECLMDEMEISMKYLRKEGILERIPEAMAYYGHALGERAFRDAFSDDAYDLEMARILEGIFVGRGACSIWGKGDVGKRFVRLFRLYGRRVEHIYDERAEVGEQIEGVPVLIPDFPLDGFVFVASQRYDREISDRLLRCGLTEGEGFVSYLGFKRAVLPYALEKYRYLETVQERTGIDLVEWVGA